MIDSIVDKIKIWHIIVACAVVYICSVSTGLSLNGDDSDYILISKSFLDQGFFHQIFISSELAKSSRCYFMLPLMLMPFLAYAPANYLLMKLVPLASAIGAVILLNILLEGTIADRHRKLILLLFAFNPWVVEYSGLILTDMPYLFFMLACLVLFKQYLEKKASYLLVLSVLFAGIAFYTRPVGAALCASLLAFTLIKKRWKDCAIILIMLLVIAIPILVHVSDISSVFIKSFVKAQDYYAYEQGEVSWQGIIYRAGRHLLVYTGSYLPDLIARPAVSSIDPRLPDRSVNPLFFLKFLVGIFICAIIVIGFFRTAKKSFSPHHLYVPFHLMMNLVISVYVARYLLSALPFLILFLIIGTMASGREKASHGTIPGAILSAILIALSLVGTLEQAVYARTGYLPGEARSFIECNDWVKANTPANAILLSRKPSYTKLYTGRDAVGYFFIDDPDVQRKCITDKKIDFVIVGDIGYYLHEAQYLIKTVKRYPGKFRLRYTTRNKPENFVYEVVRDRR